MAYIVSCHTWPYVVTVCVVYLALHILPLYICFYLENSTKLFCLIIVSHI